MKSNSYQTSSMAKRRQAQKSIDGNSKTANKHGTAIIADKGKVDAVNKTFQKEEAKQLESFIKKRSKELDEEIYRLTNKLNIGTTTEKDGTTGNSANGVSASSRSLPRGSLSDSHISDHSLELSGTQLSMQDRRELQEFYRINKTDNGDSTKSRSIRFEDEENLALTNVKMNKSNSPTRGRLAPAPEPLLDSNAILINTLARLKLHMEDAQMSGAELKEWFLPSDLELPGETCISVQELIGVLSSELGMTLTKRDLDMLLQFYGTKQGDVDVIQMLVDAGVWEDNSPTIKCYPQSLSNLPTKQEELATSTVEIPEKVVYLDPFYNTVGEGLITDPERPISPHRPRYKNDGGIAMPAAHPHAIDVADINSGNPWSKTDRSPLIHPSGGKSYSLHSEPLLDEARNIDDVKLTASPSSDSLNRGRKSSSETLLKSPSTEYLPFPGKARLETDSRSTQAARIVDEGIQSQPPAIISTPSPAYTSLIEKADVFEPAIDKDKDNSDPAVAAIIEENKALKNTLNEFDAEFFEQLEDLKYRYARLQEIVGQSPAPTGSIISDERKENVSDVPAAYRKSALPLDKLAWSARSSVNAMDRASYNSPLVSNPRPPDYYRTLPKHNTAKLSLNSPSHDDLQLPWKDSSSSFQRDTRTLTAPSLVGYPSELSDMRGGVKPHSTSFTVANDAVGNFAHFCERRLAFELTSHPSPEQAMQSLIHRVIETARRIPSRFSDKKAAVNFGYITCDELCDILASVGLRMDRKEVEILASGFASDGKGGIDATEFCETVKVLLYNLIGEHAAVVAEEKARRNADQTEENKIDYLYNLLLQIGESVLANDRRGLLTSSTNIFKTLLRPFVEMDNRSSGKLLLEEFAEVLNNLGSAIAVDDLTFLGSVYGIEDENQPLYASNSGDYVSTLRDRMLSGSLSGAAKANPTFGSWVAKTGIGLAGPANRTVVDYIAFSEKLAEVLERLIHQKNGVEIGIGSKYPWVLKEYDLIDTLICQLEEMTPSQRRRTLMSLQYALSAADHTQKGDLDGFAVLDCLLNCGFKLQRINRVRLLRAVEELGGRMNYRELCEILLNSCADWTAEERALVKHILASMGVTVIERRGWLARLRQNLMEAQSKIDRRTTKWFTDTTILGTTNSSNAQEIGIPPASFLHCLRDCGVKLSVDEEATLLDCLDTERLARESARNYSSNTAAQHIKDSWSIPMVQYESFLQFCARHCGNWYDASPEVNASLAEAVGRVSSPLLALHEFASVLATFDETDTGVISQRAFEICCNRSRLLANMSDKAIAELAEVLAVDGGGSINYSNFIVYVRTICSDSLKSTTDKSKPSIVNQLIHNATDRNGTILPLRKWILANTDIQSFVLTQRDMSTMLREFNVIYRPEDLDNLYMEIGKHVENQKFQNTRDNNVLSEISSKKGFADSLLEEEIDQARHTKKHIVDPRDLLSYVLQARDHWTEMHPSLCMKIKKALEIIGTRMILGHGTLSAMDNTVVIEDTDEYTMNHRGPRGIETAVAKKLMARFRAFAGRDLEDTSARIRNGDHLMIETDVFAQLLRLTGLPLSDEDVLVLADATDSSPDIGKIRCDVLLEAISTNPSVHISHKIHVDKNKTLSSLAYENNLSEAGVFALEHIRELIWNNGARLHRSTLEWQADVRTVVTGFDKGSTGFVSVDDFLLALSLLNSSVSPDILQDISYVPQGPGLIPYKDVLSYILLPPSKKKEAHETQRDNLQSVRATSSSDKARGNDIRAGEMSKSVNKIVGVNNKTRKFEKDSPVKLLVNVIRKSLHQFIASDKTLEEAWIHMLKVFHRFDADDAEAISPRDFCLAISVLIDGDDVILTKAEWAEIFDYFAVANSNSSKQSTRNNALNSQFISYVSFCNMVLDPAEINQKTRREGRGSSVEDNSRIAVDRGKQFLSSSVPKSKASSSVSNQKADSKIVSFDGTVAGTSFGQRPISRGRFGKSHGEKENDEIYQRFVEFSEARKLSQSSFVPGTNRTDMSEGESTYYKARKEGQQRAFSATAPLKPSSADNSGKRAFKLAPRGSNMSASDVFNSSHRKQKSTLTY